MTLTVAIQMDPLEEIDTSTDSTFVLALEAQRRGFSVYHYLPSNLALENGRLFTEATPVVFSQDSQKKFRKGKPETINLTTVDIVLLRQDPPFDMSYITSTHMLEHVHPKTLVVNDPNHVRNSPEKLFVTKFPDLMPPTLITSDQKHLFNFREEHKDVVVKPLFGNGGAGVFHVSPDDENFTALLELFGTMYREPIIIQRYEPSVRKGDKRIILIDGRPAGALNRIPSKGESRANLHIGGVAKKSSLTDREKDICEEIGPELRKRGLLFVGIDVIGGHLTEINVTSPTCLQEINRFDNIRLEEQIWDAILERFDHET